MLLMRVSESRAMRLDAMEFLFYIHFILLFFALVSAKISPDWYT